MLLKFNIENFLAFNKPVELNFEANLHTKKFLSNVVKNTQGNALKSLAIYGPNNTGKTCIVEALKAFPAASLPGKCFYRITGYNVVCRVSV